MIKKKARRKPRRAPAQLARDRRRIAELYLEGRLQAEIAQEVGLSQSTVSNDLKVLQKAWLASSLIDIDRAKARELAKIDKLEREYYRAWHRSCRNAETSKSRTIGKAVKYEDDEGRFYAEQPVELTKVSKGQAGDPRFLQGVQWCIEKRMAILGLEAAKRFALVDWREEAAERGLDPADIFELYVQQAYDALTAGDGEAAG